MHRDADYGAGYQCLQARCEKKADPNPPKTDGGTKTGGGSSGTTEDDTATAGYQCRATGPGWLMLAGLGLIGVRRARKTP